MGLGHPRTCCLPAGGCLETSAWAFVPANRLRRCIKSPPTHWPGSSWISWSYRATQPDGASPTLADARRCRTVGWGFAGGYHHLPPSIPYGRGRPARPRTSAGLVTLAVGLAPRRFCRVAKLRSLPTHQSQTSPLILRTCQSLCHGRRLVGRGAVVRGMVGIRCRHSFPYSCRRRGAGMGCRRLRRRDRTGRPIDISRIATSAGLPVRSVMVAKPQMLAY